jgi:hypothetical protein
MSQKAEAHKPGTVSRVIKVPEVNEEQAEVRIEGTDPLYGKIRIVNFLSDEMGNKHRLKEGDGVDVVICSDDIEPKKR